MKAKRKLIPAVAMLMVAAITLTSASYAWFTMSKTVTANGIELTATAPTSLLISSEKTFGSAKDVTTVTDTHIQPYAPTTTVNLKGTGQDDLIGNLNPASSLKGINVYYADQIFETNGAPTASTVFTAVDTTNKDAVGVKKDGYYIDIPLWIKSTGNKAVDVQLDLATGKTQITTLADGKIFNAARFAILNDNKTAAVSTGLGIDGYMFKSKDAAMISGLTGPIDEAGTGGEIYKGVADTAGDFATGTQKLFTMDAALNAEAPTIKKIVVRVWIEGQDVACVTKNQAHKFAVQLVFKEFVAPPVQP